MNSCISNSIFDENFNSEQQGIWESENNMKNILLNDLQQQQYLYEGYLTQKSKKIFKLSFQRYYDITKINLINALKIQFTQLNTHTSTIGFTLSRNHQDILFVANNSQEHQKWILYLSQVCILTEFQQNYKLIKLLGKGSFAKVYLAKNQKTGENYAVKIFNKEKLLEKSRGKESIKNEISIHRRLSHENIIKLYEVYESECQIYLILELIEDGVELFDIIKDNRGQFTEYHIRQIMLNFLKGIQHIHTHSIMHRDIKPQNILVSNNTNNNNSQLYSIKIIDFGLAAFVNANSYVFKKCGTPGFVAPEVFQSEQYMYNEKCDMFSAGIIIYIMLCEVHPFTAKEHRDILLLNKACKINFKHPKLIQASNQVNDLLQGLLQVNPKKRLSATEALEHPYFKDNQIIYNQNQLIIDTKELNNYQDQHLSESEIFRAIKLAQSSKTRQQYSSSIEVIKSRKISLTQNQEDNLSQKEEGEAEEEEDLAAYGTPLDCSVEFITRHNYTYQKYNEPEDHDEIPDENISEDTCISFYYFDKIFQQKASRGPSFVNHEVKAYFTPQIKPTVRRLSRVNLTFLKKPSPLN